MKNIKNNQSPSRRNAGRPRAKAIAIVVALGGVLLASAVVGIGSIANSNSPSTADTNNIHDDRRIVMHTHTTMELWLDGVQVSLPGGIGTEPHLHRDHALDLFGAGNPPVSPLHTHKDDGEIHVESTVIRSYTLGDFLDVWGVNLGTSTVSVTANGQPVSDYRSIVLADGEHITMVINQ